jgi:hypothetical protein
MVWPDWFLSRMNRGLLLVAFLILVWSGIVMSSDSWMFMSPGRFRLPALAITRSSGAIST